MNAQQLKNSILQLAVQGKLVPQDPNDEPASALIERIRAKKERLIKEKKIKPDKNPSYIFRGSDNLPYEKVGKNEPVCIAEEVPFDIPDSWEWVRLKNLSCYIFSGKSPKYSKIPTEHKIIGQQANQDYGIDFNYVKYATNDFVVDMPEVYYLKDYDVLLNTLGNGTLGRSGIFKIPVGEKILTDGHLFVFRNINPIISEYLFAFLKLKRQEIEKSANGTTNQTFLNLTKTIEWLIPLPPLSEQQRIVEKLKELEPYINDYDKAYEKIEKLNTDFPDLLKKSILQEAVQGKLVPQDPTDEPASILIEKIRQEKEQLIKDKKIKKDKNESYIFRRDNSHYEKIGTEERCIDDEIPFDIPDSWEWTRLGTITEILRGKGPKYADNTDFRILNQKCVRWGNIDTSFCKTVDKQWFESISKECLTTQKDILINSTGEGTIGRSSAVTSDAINMPYDSHVLLIRPYKCLNKYIEIFINGIEGQAQINRSKGAKTTKQTELGVDKTKNLLIPLPPLNEQQRIVDKVNQLLPQISKL